MCTYVQCTYIVHIPVVLVVFMNSDYSYGYRTVCVYAVYTTLYVACTGVAASADTLYTRARSFIINSMGDIKFDDGCESCCRR